MEGCAVLCIILGDYCIMRLKDPSPKGRAPKTGC
jgi:hypothetical protein